jgi:protoporphyrinogen oxidase
MYVCYRGHKSKINTINTALKSTPGLYLGGNYLTGVAIGDCIQAGESMASSIHTYLSSISGPTSPTSSPVATPKK